MNTPNPSDTQTDLSRVLEKITEIANASANGDYIYIYRGESKGHDKVSSNLYREYEADIEAENFDIAIVQEEILREAKEYTTHKDDSEILTELQHYGGKTNLIDFTTDYLVALFFACDGNREEPGRVILLQNRSEAYEVVKPSRTVARAGIQKSTFVQAPGGVVDPDTVVCIPADLKGAMLDYLRKHHDISTKTIYNDLQGFIENRKSHKSAYTEFYTGLTCQERGDSAEDPTEKQEWYDKAIEHYNETINLNPELAIAYNNRGNAYNDKGDFDRAIQDYNIAINLNPEYANAYANRGITYADKGDLDTAIQDYTKAIELNPELAEAYYNQGITYYHKGEFDKAIQNYDKAIDLKPEDVIAYYTRGVAYGKKGEFDRAIQDYNIAINLKPEYAEVYVSRGVAYYYKDEFDAAIQDFNKAINLNPEYAEAYANRGEAWLHLREWKKAKVDLSTAKDMGNDIVAAFHNAYGSVEAFETKYDVEVPEDIAALLRGDGN